MEPRSITDLVNTREVEVYDRLRTYIVQADPEGRIYDCSEDPTLAKLLGIQLTPEQLTARSSIEQYLSSFSIDALVNAYHEMQAGNLRNIEVSGNIPQEGSTEMHVHFNLQRTHGGHYVFLIRDETKLTQTLHQVEDALELYSAALSSIAHDMGNPLTIVKTNLQFLLEKYEDGKITDNHEEGEHEELKLGNLLESIQWATDRMMKMVGDYIVLARVEGGSYTPAIESVPLYKSVIQPVNESMHNAYPDAVYTLTRGEASLAVDEADLEVLCEPHILSNAYENLFSNAIKYGGDGTEITWAVHNSDGFLSISLRNTQSYLTEEEIQWLFEKFHRVKRLEEKAHGLGLGLHLYKRLLQAGGGNIRANSDSSTYTEFTITVPYKT